MGTEEEEEPMEEQGEEDMTISVNALSVNTDFYTFRVTGETYGHEVQILIDGGSTHCFLDEEAAIKLNCHLEHTSPMVVSVADERQMISQQYCPTFTWEIQGQVFHYPMRTLTLGGCHMVLGGDWLRHYNPVEYDYKAMTVTVSRNGKKWGFKALSQKQVALHLISAESMSKVVNEVTYRFLGQLCSISTTSVNDTLAFQETALTLLLDDYSELFQEPQGLPPTRSIEHKIVLKQDAFPRKMHPYKYSYAKKGEIETIVKGLMKDGIIRPSQSAFGSPVLLVKKKDGSSRMCVDYRYLNNLTIKHNFSIPIIDELLDELYGACYFSKIDLRSGYFQIRMAEEDVPKTSFVTHHGNYEFLVMPFGLCNAPSTFQSLMNVVFAPYLRKFILVFFDDVLVYSKNWHKHLEQLKITLELLKKNQLFAKKSKCDFGKEKVEYLGHIITKEGVSTDPSKVDCMKTWPQPKTVKELRGFLGLTGYYRKFVKGYGLISHHFIIKTDHQSLKHILEQKVYNALQQKWISKLLGLDYEIHYRKGKDNIATDALSRRDQGECVAITVIIPNWVTDVQKSYEKDEELLPILQVKTVKDSTYPSYSLQGGILRRNHMICVGKCTELREQIIRSLHDSAIGGHSGINGTYQQLKSMFYWPKMKEDVVRWAWTSISMDFIEGLPKSEGKDCIMVVVDRFTKFTNSMAYQLTSYRIETEFSLGVFERNFSEYWYNTNFHLGLNLTPFQALYGYVPRPLTVDPYIPTSQPNVEEYLKERSKLLEVLKLNLAEAQNIMKVYEDKNGIERNFVVGDYVYLKLQPYTQNSLQLRRNLKLALKYYGPFQIIEKIGEATWEDYYAFVAKFPDFEMDPQGRGSSLPGGNVTAIAGGEDTICVVHRPTYPVARLRARE
ncbi:UNVERIFIED_CONTAM: Retrovirus-related Pol polyprotein from transposon.6 [Sesamum latifolium]|uniref:Retrovirus-related Pol polyprotein from transposon.6 n=1 Tax=Sesamum latifolium TaxID=2727402 RepID=A0AAW2Y860_9LAMI